MAGTSAIIAGVVAVVGAGVSYEQNRKAGSMQKEATRIQGNQARIEQASERRRMMREERIRRAQIMAASQNTGVAGGSSESGALGAMSSVTGGNVASSFAASNTTSTLASLSSGAASARAASQTAGAVGNLGGTVFSSLGGTEWLADKFSSGGAQTGVTRVSKQG